MSSSAQNLGFDPVLLELFRAELETQTRVLEEGLLQAEAGQSAEKLEPLMRAAHSMKGAARMLGFDHAVRLAHAMEDVLVAAQRGTERLTAARIDVLLRANDIFLRAAAAAPAAIPAEFDARTEVIGSLTAELAAPVVAALAKGAVESSPAAGKEADPVLLDLFQTELQTQTRVLEEGLVNTGTEQSPEKLEALMRAVHSIKGAARMVSLERAVALSHAMENVLLAAQRGAERLTAERIGVLLRCATLFSSVGAGEPVAIPAQLDQQKEAIDRLVAELAAATRAAVVPAAARAPTSPEGPPATESKSVRVHAESLNKLLALAGECLVQTRLTRSLLTSLQRIKQWQTGAASGLEHTRDLLREGDATAALSVLERALEPFRQAHDLLPKHMQEFSDWTHRLELLVNPLYNAAVTSRMRPFADGTHGYARMVRDLARELGKKVHFEIDGPATPVDREILDRLESPLTHLLRNALDHGIETPGERSAAGKPAEGRLVLSARQLSGSLRIAVTDDGAGINIAELRRKVAAAGYVSPDMADALGEAEVLEFLFLSGFSTSRTVTEVSGRGVGLDVVHATVRTIGGSVRIQSEPGAGTTIELQLPLTLSIVRALLAEIGGETYAVPLTRIDRLVRTIPDDLHLVEDRQFCTVDGEHVGILDARQVLGTHAERKSPGLCVVVLSDRLSRYGLVVDRFLGERDLVVKPLPACLGKVPNVGAGAILDDGSPVLILDADDLVRSMERLLAQGSLQKVLAPAPVGQPHGRRRVLVVDDSLTVREVERRLLENSGYEVVVAIDGMDGWNALQRSSFDLLVTDVDMPRMDGLELVRRVRSAPRTADLPIVIVSYKEQPEYRIKGMEAGANYYLTKSSFHDETLVGAVRDLIGEA